MKTMIFGKAGRGLVLSFGRFLGCKAAIGVGRGVLFSVLSFGRFLGCKAAIGAGRASRGVVLSLLALAMALVSVEGQAQVFNPGDPLRAYLRILPVHSDSPDHVQAISWLNGTAGYDQLWSYTRSAEGVAVLHPWQRALRGGSFVSQSGGLHVRPFAPQVFMSQNETHPTGGNDGALWQGVGNNLAVSGGVRMRYGAFTLDVRPVYVYSENREFALSHLAPDLFLPEGTVISEFARPLVRADYPQRFGEAALSRLDPGLTEFSYARTAWKAGVSFAPMWTGPAVYNPLLLSDNAPGFLHVFAATNAPVRTREGLLYLRYFWGGLEGSDYFIGGLDARRYITGLSVVFAPRRAPGLELGLNRVAYGDWSDGLAGPGVLFRALQPNPKEPLPGAVPEDNFLAMFSFSARWALPGTGFETYMEWGRNDYRRGLRDLYLEPELNRGYVFGFLKRYEVSDRHWLVFNAEMTQLENSSISALRRPRRTWYEDPFIPGGFTHRGQVLGAAIGPGSSAQTLALSWYHPYGMLGVSGGRVVHNNDRLFNNRRFYEDLQGGFRWNTLRKLHQVEMRLSAWMLVFLPYGAEVQVGVVENRIENIYNVINTDKTNVRVEFALRLRRPGWL
jgi:hypothetical protein